MAREEVVAGLSGGGPLLVACHRGPDGDALGSMVALLSLVRRLGGEAAAVLERACPPELDFLGRPGEFFVGAGAIPPFGTLALLDCSTLARTGELAAPLRDRARRIVVVDHHRPEPPDFGEAEWAAWIDPAAPATAALILELHDAFGLRPDPAAADGLLTGLLTDTYWLQNGNAGPGAVAALARLLGECRPTRTTAEIYDLVFRRYPAGMIGLLAAALGRAELLPGGLLFTWVAREEVDRAGIGELETEFLNRPLLAVGEARATAVVHERAPGRLKFSFRSKGGGQALALARRLGGGGHREAAGAELDGDPANARAALLKAWAEAAGLP